MLAGALNHTGRRLRSASASSRPDRESCDTRIARGLLFGCSTAAGVHAPGSGMGASSTCMGAATEVQRYELQWYPTNRLTDSLIGSIQLPFSVCLALTHSNPSGPHMPPRRCVRQHALSARVLAAPRSLQDADVQERHPLHAPAVLLCAQVRWACSFCCRVLCVCSDPPCALLLQLLGCAAG